MFTSRYRHILFDFSQSTSAHGIPHVGRATNWCARIFWVIIFLVASALLIWQVILLVQKYLEYDKVTKMELRFTQRPFPAITLCNLNPYKASKVSTQQHIQNLLVAYNCTSTKLRSNNTAPEANECKNETIKAVMRDANLLDLNDIVAMESRAKEYLVLLSADVSANTRSALSYTRNEFLVSCSYNTEDCQLSDFNQFLDPKFGNCFTFNFAEPAQYNSTRAGPLYGLRLVMRTDISEYILTSEASGVRVIVHNQSEVPFPDTFGYNAAAGYATSFGVSYREIERLGSPYGECQTEEDLEQDGEERYEGSYTMEGCFRHCLQEQISKNCSCYDPRYATPTDDTKTPLCSLFNKNASTCFKNFYSQENANIAAKCECPQPCSEGVFDVTVSTAKWPSGAFIVPGCNASVADCTALYRDNALMIEVYYEQLNYRLLSESPAYSMVNLISDFGGQAGLWLGLSVVTGIEVIVLVGQLISAACRKKKDDVAGMGHPHGNQQPPMQQKSMS